MNWSPEDINKLIVSTTACLCLLVLVIGTMVGISLGYISSAILGQASAAGVGGGLVGLAWVLRSVIRSALPGEKQNEH